MKHDLRTVTLVASLVCATAGGCIGVIGGGDGEPTVDAASVSRAGLQRLSQREYDNTLADLLGETVPAGKQLLPADDHTPFDNDYATQYPSKALIEGAELAATESAARLIADVPRRDAVVGCAPASIDDAECLRAFVTRFGRRALRRPLLSEEVERLVTATTPLALDAGDFYVGVESVVRALLQHPEFLYRIEVGTPVDGSPGLYRLNDFEVASRLSYLLWGTMPDDALLDRAQVGALRTSAELRQTAIQMLAHPKAAQQVARFHALWLGYDNLPGDELGVAMRRESDALVERVVFEEKRPWQDLLRIEETFVSDTLASHYGLVPPGSAEPTWVSYGSTGRRGLLSHASFLRLGGKFGDTSPTTRGLMIRTRLLCQVIPPPPPGVSVDEPPGDPSDCKVDRYAAHRSGGCASCHQQLDPVGFGLESYDGMGRFRSSEPNRPECAIRGEGELVPYGSFKGPAELGDLLLEAGIDDCLRTQMTRFVVGRADLGSAEKKLIARAAGVLGDGDFRLDELIVELVSADTFGYRRAEEE